MKVIDVIKQKEAIENIFCNLQKLEKLFQNDKNLDEKIADKAGINMPVGKVLTEVRMVMYEKVLVLEEKINNAVIQD